MAREHKKIISLSIGVSILAVKTVFQMNHGCCRFYPSCTEFAKEAIETLPFNRALMMIVKRVTKCQPFVRGGYDPVPERSSVWKEGNIT
jgi:putative membrane protein insertion efficiency factor